MHNDGFCSCVCCRCIGKRLFGVSVGGQVQRQIAAPPSRSSTLARLSNGRLDQLVLRNAAHRDLPHEAHEIQRSPPKRYVSATDATTSITASCLSVCFFFLLFSLDDAPTCLHFNSILLRNTPPAYCRMQMVFGIEIGYFELQN